MDLQRHAVISQCCLQECSDGEHIASLADKKDLVLVLGILGELANTLGPSGDSLDSLFPGARFCQTACAQRQYLMAWPARTKLEEMT